MSQHTSAITSANLSSINSATTMDTAPLQITNRRRITKLTKFFAFALGAMSLIVAMPQKASAGGAYGADTCKSGYVWREANADDHVCVRPSVRTQTARDNAQARYRVAPYGGPYGNNTCRSGYVWREAYSGDVVCVTPATRAQAARDNAQAPYRYAP